MACAKFKALTYMPIFTQIWAAPAHSGSAGQAPAGRLRRAQTFLRTLGIEMIFGREGRAGTRTIRISSAFENRRAAASTVCTVGTVYPEALPHAARELALGSFRQ